MAQAAEENTVFGRITPQQKEDLVHALRTRGHYVAMIGDGVNDVLSLKQANLGIAMQSGSQATRAVADIILMGSSFASLPYAVREGQRIINGMQDILKLFLTAGAVRRVAGGVRGRARRFPVLPQAQLAAHPADRRDSGDCPGGLGSPGSHRRETLVRLLLASCCRLPSRSASPAWGSMRSIWCPDSRPWRPAAQPHPRLKRAKCWRRAR